MRTVVQNRSTKRKRMLTARGQSKRKTLPFTHDSFLSDSRLFSGRSPRDLTANHDVYLYGRVEI